MEKQDLGTMQQIAEIKDDLRIAPTLSIFKTRLKTFMFALDFC